MFLCVCFFFFLFFLFVCFYRIKILALMPYPLFLLKETISAVSSAEFAQCSNG